MKFAFIFFLLLLSSSCFSQSKPENMEKSSIKENKKVEERSVKGKEYFINQIKINPQNADAWYNYYFFIEQSRELSQADRKLFQSEIYSSSSVYIKNSWQYSLFKFIESGKKDSAALFNALNLAENKILIYPYVIQYAIINNDENLLKEFSSELNRIIKMSPATFEYHYNTLMSAEKDAFIYAKGLNDLVPLAILQNVYSVRNDLKLKYYNANIDENENSYLCISLGKEIISKFTNGVYSGLLVKLGHNENFKAPDFEKVFKLFSLNHTENLSEDELMLYRNYLPSFILYYQKLVKSNDKDAKKWREIIEKLGRQTGMQKSVESLLNNNLN